MALFSVGRAACPAPTSPPTTLNRISGRGAIFVSNLPPRGDLFKPGLTLLGKKEPTLVYSTVLHQNFRFWCGMFTVDCLKTLSFVNLESGQPGGFETSTSKVNLEFIGNSKFPRSKTTDSQCCRQLTWLAFWPDGDLHRKPANSKFRSLEDECNWILSGREPVLGTSFTTATNNTRVSIISVYLGKIYTDTFMLCSL